jgi:hypothetical protein
VVWKVLIRIPLEIWIKIKMTLNLDEYAPSEEQKKQLNSLLMILEKCEENGVEMVVAGGYSLDGLYGKLTRPHEDVDMIVMNSNMSNAQKIMEGLGYQQYFGDSDKNKFVYHNSDGFKVEFVSSDLLAKYAGKDGLDFFIPQEKNAELNGYRFKAMTLKGQLKFIDIQNERAKEMGGWEKYPKYKEENRTELIESLSRAQPGPGST